MKLHEAGITRIKAVNSTAVNMFQMVQLLMWEGGEVQPSPLVLLHFFTVSLQLGVYLWSVTSNLITTTAPTKATSWGILVCGIRGPVCRPARLGPYSRYTTGIKPSQPLTILLYHHDCHSYTLNVMWVVVMCLQNLTVKIFWIEKTNGEIPFLN